MIEHHTARREYECTYCDGPIRPGTRYVRAALPPWTGGNESEHFWHLKAHGMSPDSCPKLDAS